MEIPQISYSDFFFSPLVSEKRDFPGDKEYEVLKFGTSFTGLEVLIRDNAVIRVIDVPESGIFKRSFKGGIPKGNQSNLPHQDFLEEDDKRRWSVYLSRGRRNASTYVVLRPEILFSPVYLGMIQSLYEHNSEHTKGILEEKSRIQSRIPIPRRKLREAIDGTLYMKASEGDFDSLREYLLITERIFKDCPRKEIVARGIYCSLLDKYPSDIFVEHWQTPNTMLIVDDPRVFHARIGSNTSEENEASISSRQWIIDEYVRRKVFRVPRYDKPTLQHLQMSE